MNATIDLDDADALLSADRDGSLQAASMAGAQVRAVGTAVAEGALDALRADDRSRAVVWVAGRGIAATAGAILAGALSDTLSVPFVTAARAPVWVGPLDVMVVAGDDAGDPALSSAVSLGTRRGARVVIAAPNEGPLADSGAGRAMSLAPRLRVPDTFGLAHNLAAGAAVLGVVDRASTPDVMTIADEVDGEVSRNTVVREVFTNAAKAIAVRLAGGPAVLCGDRSATLALAGHAAATLLRLTQRTVTACGLPQALAAVRDALSHSGSGETSLFHDEFIDGPRGDGPPRILALATDSDVQAVTARIEGVDDAELVGTTDLGEAAARPSELGQLMMLAARLEMASVYARLGGGAIRAVNLLRGAIRTYAWGSRTAIAEFTGRPTPTPHPEAELWLGAHPADPAYLVTGSDAKSLLDVVAADPAGQLGSASVAEFGDQLPFLLKVLAADEPLSLQAHPSAQQAADGYAREEAAGVPLNSPVRNYRDRNHKPELVVALDRFEALAGFREPGDTVELFRALDVDELTPYVNLLDGQSDADGLRALFTTWITLPQPSLDLLVPAVLDGAVRYLSSGNERFVAEARTLLELGERYPADAGVLASLLLNRLTLEPGEGIYLPAGNLHAYLRGLAVEIMANSDNVLRGGLTPKHVDVPELLRVLDFSPAAEKHLHVETAAEGAQTQYRTPAREFALSRFDLEDGVRTPVAGTGPRILLCTTGSVRVDGTDTDLAVHAGQSVWVPADGGGVTLTGQSGARVFMATVDADV